MERLDEIFDQETQGSGDLDIDLTNASHVLSKLSEDVGVDLSQLSDKDVADLLQELLPGGEAADTTTQEPAKEASAMSQQPEPQNTPTLTVADIGLELAKVAAANGIDISKVSPAEYAEAFDQMAETMRDPQKLAEVEKLNQAYAQGQRMADGFLDRMKQAEEEENKMPPFAKKDEKPEGKKDDKEEKEEKKEAGFRAAMEAAKSKAKGAVSKAGEHGSKLLAHAKEHRTTTGAAAGAAAGGAMGARGGRSKEALDQQAMAVAAELAKEAGVDLSEVTGEPTPDQIADRALEILKEAGVTLPKS